MSFNFDSGGSKKRGVVKEGVSKGTRNVMVEEAAAINDGKLAILVS